MLSSAVTLLLIIPQLAVAVRRLHDLGKSGRELVVPCLMLLLLPLAFAFRGILPQIVALGFLGLTLLAFAHLLTLFMRAQERQMLGESLFENRAVSVVQRANERLAGIKCRSPQGILGKVKGK